MQLAGAVGVLTSTALATPPPSCAKSAPIAELRRLRQLYSLPQAIITVGDSRCSMRSLPACLSVEAGRQMIANSCADGAQCGLLCRNAVV